MRLNGLLEIGLDKQSKPAKIGETMTQKDYVKLAGVIADCYFNGGDEWDDAIRCLTENMCKMLKSDNPKFNKDIFLKACGIKS